uniref:Serpentine Receptor, class T n=2 Tax=Haemonchus contortus TaxID=6289 RepID=A0A7I4YLM3_HAECO
MSIDLQMAYVYTLTHGHPYLPLYDCSTKSLQEWYATGSVKWSIGLYFLITGILLEMIYCPCLVAMYKQNLLSTSCYKIMFFLGILDMFSIFVNSIMTGYFAIKGAVFCTNPVTLLTLGAFGCACWCASCLTCIFLALNRCADLSENRFLTAFFDGNRVFFLMFLSVLHFAFIMLFTTPASFNSNYVSWFFNPMTGQESLRYVNIYHAVNNVIVAVSTTSLYIYLCIKLYFKTRNASTKMGNIQRKIFIQSFLICLINVLAAYVYVYMQYFTPSKWVVLTGQIAWQLSSGFVCIIYLTVNSTIRKGVIDLLLPKRWASKFHRTPTTRVSDNRIASTSRNRSGSRASDRPGYPSKA